MTAPPFDFTKMANDATASANSHKASTWDRVNLDPYLDGSAVRPEPTIGLPRTDGLRLIYPGKEHAVIGEMECGKSWLLCACAATELKDGNPVLYVHFEEADPADTIERLQVLGVSVDKIRTGLVFVGPNEPLTGDKLARLLDDKPRLVVFDGVNEAMSLHSQKIRDEDGAAAFRRLLVKPCTAAGAATLAADHVVKDKERRGRDALGSVHKGNGLTGSLIMLENVEPFGRDMRGRSHVFITKDRPGHLRRHGRRSGIPGKTFVGELVVDDSRPYEPLDLVFYAPTEQDEMVVSEVEVTDDEVVLATVVKIAADGFAPTGKRIRSASSLRHGRTDDALVRLVLAGRLTETDGRNWQGVPSNARVFTPTSPSPQDQTTD